MRIIYTFILSLFCLSVIAQEDPNGIKGVNNKTDVKVLYAPNERNLFLDKIESPVFNINDSLNMTIIKAEKTSQYEIENRPGSFRFVHDSYAFDYSYSGTIINFKYGSLYGFSIRNTMPGLMSVQSSNIEFMYNLGRLSLNAKLYGNRYLMQGIDTQLGIGGGASYIINSNLSVTLFGNYYSINPYYSMATFPNISTSAYGGYFTLKNDDIGIDLGMQHRYNPYSRRWDNVPIVTPKFRVGKKVMIELPVGDLMKSTLEDSFNKDKKNRGGGTIMPEGMHAPIQIR